MSLVYLVVLPILASFLTPLYKNSLRVISVLLHLVLLYIIVQFSFELPIKEFIGFDSPLSITFVLHSSNLLFAILFIMMILLYSLFHLKSENDKAIFITTNTLTAGVLGLILSIDIFNIYNFIK
jgi:formate hydrogenlyase subunit 3/multisubunit Na+/H+ antiporter MnhD subunit